MSHQTAVVVSWTKPDEDNPYGSASHVLEDYEMNDLIRGEVCEELKEFWVHGSDGFDRIETMFKYGADGGAVLVPVPELRCVELSFDQGASEDVAMHDLAEVRRLFNEMTFDEFRYRSLNAYQLGKILGGTTFADQVVDEDVFQVRTWVAGLGDQPPLPCWIVQAFDIDT